MNRIFHKAGKVWSMISQDGLFNSFFRIIGFVKVLLKPTGKGDILIITSGVGDSALYRGRHVAEELNEHGFRARTTTQDNLFLLKKINEFDVFILHRVTCSSKIQQFLKLAKQKEKTVLFETDDLTFDVNHIKKSNAYKNMNALEKSQYDEEKIKCLFGKNNQIKYATTTTEKLASHLKRKNKSVFVVPNKLSKLDVEVADKILKEKKKHADDEIIIGYFSGSASHDRDFATVSSALVRILEQYKQVKLLVAGPINLGDKFEKFSNRVIRTPYVARHKHFENVASCDINIAPLEIGDDFCESKSEIKFTEAGLLQVPTVASATEVFKKAIENGKNGFVAESESQWHSALKNLVESKKLRKSVALEARKTVLSKYLTISDGNNEYYNFLRQKIDGNF